MGYVGLYRVRTYGESRSDVIVGEACGYKMKYFNLSIGETVTNGLSSEKRRGG